ncbi:MAG: carboxylating nicotinate-nucleotide diphosphorylase [Mycobacteriales bacterium]
MISADTRDRLTAAGLDPAYVQDVIDRALAEDLPTGLDATSSATVGPDHSSTGRFVARVGGVVAGIPVAALVLETLGEVRVEMPAADGDRVSSGDAVLVVTGRTRGILTAERTALNLLGQLSGVATLTRRWADELAGTGAVVRDTRKTIPGLRSLQKYAVRCGGGTNHRMSLSDAALVKDNHVVAAGGVAAAFTAVRRAFPGLEVEVECDTVEQVREAVSAGADLVLLDNMSLPDLRASVAIARDVGGVRTEASGGLSLADAAAVGATGVDYVSVGGLTHSAPVLDFGLDLELEQPPG